MTVPTPARRLPPWGIPATIGWTVLAFVLSAIAVGAVFGLLGHGYPGLSASSYDGVAIAVGALVSIPVQVAVLVLAAQRRGWSTVDYLALTAPRRGEIIMAIICAAALVLLFDVALFLTGHDLVTPFQTEGYRSAREAGWLVAFLVAVIVFAPVGEEIAFRGFLYRGLARPGYEIHAIVAIALVWAALHIQYDWLGVGQVFAIGLLLGWIRWASGSTTLAILVHVLINLESMIETAVKVGYLS